MDGGYSAKKGNSAPVPGLNNDGEEYPIVCEVCLGDNPYVRMIKSPYGSKLCKFSGMPFQSFRWKAGSKGRYKETVVSPLVAKERNICQACLNDLTFNVPVGLRDRMVSSETSVSKALPESDVGMRHYCQELALHGNQDEDTTSFATHMENMPAYNQLTHFSSTINPSSRNQAAQHQSSRTAFRNLPKLCSFWLNGSCNRVLRKSCPFRPCCGTFLFPELAGQNRELNDQLIARLEKEGPAAVMKSLEKEVKEAFRHSLKGNKEQAIRQRVNGTDDLSKKYHDRILKENSASEIENAPENCSSLWVGNVDASRITQEDLVNMAYPFGILTSVVMIPDRQCAFLHYAKPSMAENAMKSLKNSSSLVINGCVLRINWAKPKLDDPDNDCEENSGKNEDEDENGDHQESRQEDQNKDHQTMNRKRKSNGHENGEKSKKSKLRSDTAGSEASSLTLHNIPYPPGYVSSNSYNPSYPVVSYPYPYPYSHTNAYPYPYSYPYSYPNPYGTSTASIVAPPAMTNKPEGDTKTPNPPPPPPSSTPPSTSSSSSNYPSMNPNRLGGAIQYHTTS